ncbi:MAG: tRNA pseudouridine(38-40) synthase TruA [Chloroflexota bacterium]|nr:tRNA pseudouridine(38-40) synthase TruA [Chloroflexota bacterium]
MARYKIILAYDGTRFHGSQRQREVRTVQGEVEEALRKLDWVDKSTLFAGRTDAGVHASGQVAVFDLEWRHPPEDLMNALNANLPDDVAVRRIAETASTFHPRYDAVSRKYSYRVIFDPQPHPLEERYAWRVWPPAELIRLQAAAKAFLGIKDFAAFGRAMKHGGITIREVMAVNWYHDNNYLIFEITANAFLYHMVRRLVYTQMMVGQENLSIDEINLRLQVPDTLPIHGLAPPQGLSLVEVRY